MAWRADKGPPYPGPAGCGELRWWERCSQGSADRARAEVSAGRPRGSECLGALARGEGSSLLKLGARAEDMKVLNTMQRDDLGCGRWEGPVFSGPDDHLGTVTVTLVTVTTCQVSAYSRHCTEFSFRFPLVHIGRYSHLYFTGEKTDSER